MIETTTVTTPRGQELTIVTLSNTRIRVVLTDLGARILELHVPDRHGVQADVVLGRGSYDELMGDPCYFGVTAGRYANRIRGGRFEIDGETFDVTSNEGSNHLHGGNPGFDSHVWSVRADDTRDSVTFSRTSPDGEEGYPGTLMTDVTYTLTDSGLEISIESTTDRPTVVNIVNHAYFNMAGHDSGTILDQLLTIHGSFYTPVDPDSLPTGEILGVAGTPFDFRTATPVGKNIEQVENAGYDHNWVLGAQGMRPVASLADPRSGRRLTVVSDQPGIQVYAGGYLDGFSAKGPLETYRAFAGLTVEMQTFPDSPNVPHFPQRVLRPGETYTSLVSYEFSTVD